MIYYRYEILRNLVREKSLETRKIKATNNAEEKLN